MVMANSDLDGGAAPDLPAGGRGHPSDLRDAEWARLEPMIPPARPGGRPRKTDMRPAMNAILYLLRTGCPWRYLPRDSFPPRSTVYNIFRKVQRDPRTGRTLDCCGEGTFQCYCFFRCQ